MTPGLIIVAVAAALIVAAIVAASKAVHDAPVLEDEPSQLDLWDQTKDADQ